MATLHRHARWAATSVLTVTSLVALSGCVPGSQASAPKARAAGNVSKNVSKAGKLTLTVWDAENGAGTNPVEDALNKQFEAKYPNVSIHRTTRDFANLKTTLKLALSSNTPPDVVEVNQGYPDMGAFVKAGLIQPLDGYAQAYGWDARIPQSARELDSFANRGTQIGKGSLYGVPQTGSLVSFYYNKKKLAAHGLKVPTSWGQMMADMTKIKKSGDTPLWFGNQDKYEAISLFATALDATSSAAKVRNLVYGRSGSWNSPQVVAAARLVADMASKGYITPGANGLAGGQALSDFSKGKGVFYLDGDWDSATLGKAMGSNVGMFLPPPGASKKHAAEGGQGGAWAITSKSRNADVAGAYIDFLTSHSAEHMLSSKGNLPIVDSDTVQPPAGSVTSDVYQAWHTVNADDGVTPYLDYSTPTFYDTLTAALQDLIGGRTTPQKFAAAMQQDYSTFLSER
ncbi:MAG: extracellular solute-binding protein [Nocardioidaceae bacterium]